MMTDAEIKELILPILRGVANRDRKGLTTPLFRFRESMQACFDIFSDYPEQIFPPSNIDKIHCHIGRLNDGSGCWVDAMFNLSDDTASDLEMRFTVFEGNAEPKVQIEGILVA